MPESAVQLLESLVGKDITTVTGRPNRVLAVESVWGAFIRSGAALRSYRVLVDEAAEPVASADRSR